jgi:hypothetical protein
LVSGALPVSSSNFGDQNSHLMLLFMFLCR